MTPVHHGAALPSSDGEGRAVRMSGPVEPSPVEPSPGVASPSAAPSPGAASPSAAPLPALPSSSDPGAGLLTPRLRLSPVAEADEAELFTLHSDPRAFVEDSTAPLTDPAQMRWVLARWRESWARHGIGHLAVRAREGVDLPVGLLGVVGLVPLAADAETAGPAETGETTGRPAGTVLSAYWRLHPEVTGLGVATEAMRAMLESLPAEALPTTARRIAPAPHVATIAVDAPAPADTPARRRPPTPADCATPYEIVAITARGNEASLALASRLGFRPAPPERPVPGGRADDVLLLRGASPSA